jgi:hypothetical protein
MDVVLMLALISNFQSIAVTLGSRGGLLRKGLLTRVRRKSAATFFSIVTRLVVLIQRIIHMRHITSPTPRPKKHTTRPRRHQSRQSPCLEVLSIIHHRDASNSCGNVSGLSLLDSTTHLHASGGRHVANYQIVALLSPSKSIYPCSSSSNTSLCSCPTSH